MLTEEEVRPGEKKGLVQGPPMSDRLGQHWSAGPASQPGTPPETVPSLGAGHLIPLTLVRKVEASSNPQAFIIDIGIPDLNLPEIINVVRGHWTWDRTEQPRGGDSGPGTLSLLPLFSCPLALAPSQPHLPALCFQRQLLVASKGSFHMLCHTSVKETSGAPVIQQRC